MHQACWNFVAECVRGLGPRRRVVEFGSYDVNGSVRRMFGEAEYVGIDTRAGSGVDVVANAAEWMPEALFDTVFCLEAMEHDPTPYRLVENARRVLADDGVFILTAAGRDRKPHSAIDGAHYLRNGEHYANIQRDDLETWLSELFGCRYLVREVAGAVGGLADGGTIGDIQAMAWLGVGRSPTPAEWHHHATVLNSVRYPR